MSKHPAPVAKQPITWVIIADGAQARFYTVETVERRIPLAGNAKHHHYTEKHELALAPIPGGEMKAESLSDYDFGQKQLGRVFESSSAARHMAEPRLDVHTEVKQKMMHAVAQRLNAAARKKTFDRLIVAAPPKLLGELKHQLDKHVQERIKAELPKELTNFAPRDLVAQLESLLVF